MTDRRERAVPVESSPDDRERVLGGLEVEALLRVGSERLFLVFTRSRLILAHQAKLGRGSVPMVGLFGKMADGFKRNADRTASLQKLGEMEPEGILRLDRDNFAIDFHRVVSLIVEPVEGRSKVTLVTPDDKFELYASRTAAEGVREELGVLLAGKVEYRTG